jgi:exopolyphosphatase / guanosine-5'-triphosphate,3'-diphosphate pyrophosphatase
VTRVAALDCGTNSLRLLVADVVDGRLVDLERRMEIVRLGEGVDRTGRFADAALARTFGVLDEYAAAIASYDVDPICVRLVATSASRDVGNRAEFVAGVRSRIGVEPDVVTGDVEASLSFTGATAELRGSDGHPQPYLVVDIGGGSTEFARGDDTGLAASRSVDIGCVRMTERHLTGDPPTVEQVTAARADIERALDLAAERVELTGVGTLIGVAGTVTTVVMMALGLPGYDAERLHGARASAAQVSEVTERLIAMPHAERAQVPGMHPGRVDVIAGGALVLDAVLRRTGAAEVMASEHDILDGIAMSTAERAVSG